MEVEKGQEIKKELHKITLNAGLLHKAFNFLKK
jgi:hypothetical protein